MFVWYFSVLVVCCGFIESLYFLFRVLKFECCVMKFGLKMLYFWMECLVFYVEIIFLWIVKKVLIDWVD